MCTQEKVRKVRLVIEADYHEDNCEGFTNWRADLNEALGISSPDAVKEALADLSGSYPICGCGSRHNGRREKKYGFHNVRVVSSAQEV